MNNGFSLNQILKQEIWQLQYEKDKDEVWNNILEHAKNVQNNKGNEQVNNIIGHMETSYLYSTNGDRIAVPKFIVDDPKKLLKHKITATLTVIAYLSHKYERNLFREFIHFSDRCFRISFYTEMKCWGYKSVDIWDESRLENIMYGILLWFSDETTEDIKNKLIGIFGEEYIKEVW